MFGPILTSKSLLYTQNTSESLVFITKSGVVRVVYMPHDDGHVLEDQVKVLRARIQREQDCNIQSENAMREDRRIREEEFEQLTVKLREENAELLRKYEQTNDSLEKL